MASASTNAPSSLPIIGRWIKWCHTKEGREFKCKVLGYEDVASSTYVAEGLMDSSGFHTTTEKSVTVKYVDGTDDSLDQEDLDHYKWSYCEDPSKEEAEKAKYEELNRYLERACNTCMCKSKKLQTCTGCHKVYYCDATCQRANWKTHKIECKQETVVLKPNPRYPLAKIVDKVKQNQTRIQAENHKIIQEALAGNFTAQHTGWCFFLPPQTGAPLVRNPKAGSDMLTGERYKLEFIGKEFSFKWRGLESSGHSIPEGNPTSCSALEYLEIHLTQDVFKKGGLHFLVSSGKGGEETFWYMLINFNTFGTVAPFQGPCHCNPNNVKGQMPIQLQELVKKWDNIFKRAKADLNDIQCMFSNSKEGCHNFKDCPYKHDIEVKEVKKKAQ